MMQELVGKKVEFSGMVIEIIADDGESLKCNNITTKQSLIMQKAVLVKAIKLGKAEVVSDQEEH